MMCLLVLQTAGPSTSLVHLYAAVLRAAIRYRDAWAERVGERGRGVGERGRKCQRERESEKGRGLRMNLVCTCKRETCSLKPYV